jgi:N-methylhydantoinase A
VQPTTCAVYARERLAPDATIEGPAVIEEYASTTVLFPGDRVRVAETGELIVTVRPGEA